MLKRSTHKFYLLQNFRHTNVKSVVNSKNIGYMSAKIMYEQIFWLCRSHMRLAF